MSSLRLSQTCHLWMERSKVRSQLATERIELSRYPQNKVPLMIQVTFVCFNLCCCDPFENWEVRICLSVCPSVKRWGERNIYVDIRFLEKFDLLVMEISLDTIIPNDDEVWFSHQPEISGSVLHYCMSPLGGDILLHIHVLNGSQSVLVDLV